MKNIRKRQKEIYDLFGLNPTERLVLGQLGQHDYRPAQNESAGKKVSELAAALSLPRMTCHDAIKSLEKRRLIVEKRFGRSKHYFAADPDTVVEMVRGLFSTEIKGPESSPSGRPLNPKFEYSSHPEAARTIKDEITIYSGLENCHAVWRKIAELNRGDRFLCVQPNSSIQATIDKLGVRALYPSNDALNSKGIIIEGLIHSNFYEEFFRLLKREAGHDFAMTELEKFAHRTANVSLINPKYLTSPTEMFFMHDATFIVNWKDEVAIEIHNKVMCGFLRELYDLACGYGKKINQAEHVQALVERLEVR